MSILQPQCRAAKTRCMYMCACFISADTHDNITSEPRLGTKYITPPTTRLLMYLSAHNRIEAGVSNQYLNWLHDWHLVFILRYGCKGMCVRNCWLYILREMMSNDQLTWDWAWSKSIQVIDIWHRDRPIVGVVSDDTCSRIKLIKYYIYTCRR